MKLDRRLVPPLLITLILIGAHFSVGMLRSYQGVALSVGAALATDLLVGRLLLREGRHWTSSYISGISIGILVRTTLLWPFALGAVLSILSKYVLRLRGRHIWNPSNFGLCILLFFAPQAVAPLSVQWGNELWPMLVIWAVGLVAVGRVGRLHVTLTYLVAFVAFAGLRSAVTGHVFLSEVAPLTGPMYQLFALFMVTDPKTSVSTRRGRIVVVVLVAAVEAGLRLLEVVYAPFLALFIVGPLALTFEIERGRASGATAPVARETASAEA